MTTPHLGRRTHLGRLLLVLGTALALLAAGGAPGASAKAKKVTDPVNQPAAADVRSVRYTDAEYGVTALVKVRALGPAGSLLVRIGPQDADVMYFATVTRTAAGAVTKKLAYVTNTGTTTKRCGFAASWSTTADTIRVSVPQACLKFGVFLSKHWVAATMRAGGATDAAKPANLGRGDSPGCVTRREFRRIARGQLIAGVHAALDTAGRFGAGGAGGYSRVYEKCAGKGRYAVEYRGDTGAVATKFTL